jgi:hypothetical protein
VFLLSEYLPIGDITCGSRKEEAVKKRVICTGSIIKEILNLESADEALPDGAIVSIRGLLRHPGPQFG